MITGLIEQARVRFRAGQTCPACLRKFSEKTIMLRRTTVNDNHIWLCLTCEQLVSLNSYFFENDDKGFRVGCVREKVEDFNFLHPEKLLRHLLSDIDKDKDNVSRLLLMRVYAEHFNKLASGEKKTYHRMLGEKYNLHTCRPGRRIIFFGVTRDSPLSSNRVMTATVESVEIIAFEKVPEPEHADMRGSSFRHEFIPNCAKVVAISVGDIVLKD